MPRPAKNTTQQSYNPPGTTRRPSHKRGPSGDVTIRNDAETCEIPLKKKNKVSIYFYKEKKEKKKKILKENYILSMFIHSMLKDYRVGELCPKTEGGCSGFAASPSPAPLPAPPGHGESEDGVMESRGRC